MSHKHCDCNECTTIGYWPDDKPMNLREAPEKKPIQIKQPPMEAFLFTPEDHEAVFEDPIGFRTIDTGNKQTFSTGMQRNASEGKPRYDLIWKPGLKRLAELYARGAKVYGDRNWEKASTQEEMDRFDESLLRHVFQLLEGDRSEDHMAAIVFNAFGREMVREKLKK